MFNLGLEVMNILTIYLKIRLVRKKNPDGFIVENKRCDFA